MRLRAFNQKVYTLQPVGPWKVWSILAVLALFVGCGLLRFWEESGDDLASSYVGCRLMATGNASHLYSYDPVDFPAVGPDTAWQDAADWGNYEDFLHPYVQTPLWAYALQPICGTSFAVFEHLFEISTLLSFAACVWLVARIWAPSLWNPYAIAITVLCLWFSQPFQYAMALMQTHVLFLLLTVGSLILAQRKSPVWAGLLLALAAAVKITPGILVIYWLLTRRWKAAASMILWSGALAVLTVVTTGHQATAEYLADLHRISRVLLLSFNNQSVASWWMSRFYPGQVGKFRILPLPDAVRIGSMLLMIGLTIAGGIIDRHRENRLNREADATDPPLGAMIGLIAATICAPIAWTHYFIVLLVPLMVLWEVGRRMRNWGIAVAVVLIAALNLRPLAMNMDLGKPDLLTVIRSEFYSGVLCLATLATVAWMKQRDAAAVKRDAETSSSETG
jgi:hypothetical protein